MEFVTEREVYPNAPIVLVAIEVRHPLCEPLERKQVAELSKRLRGQLPLPGEITRMSFGIQAGPGGQFAAQPPSGVTSPRWTSRDKRTALTVSQDSLLVETTNYGSYERVRALLSLALDARNEVQAPDGVERVGLRYIDEIRVPTENGDASPSWQEWVDASLIGPTDLGQTLGLVSVGNEGTVIYSGTDNVALVLRYGAQNDYAVQSTPQLRRPLPPVGPLFKLDIDSFWQAGEEVPEFSTEGILELGDRLHQPIREAFEAVITDRLRKEVLRHG